MSATQEIRFMIGSVTVATNIPIADGGGGGEGAGGAILSCLHFVFTGMLHVHIVPYMKAWRRCY